MTNSNQQIADEELKRVLLRLFNRVDLIMSDNTPEELADAIIAYIDVNYVAKEKE
jgi:hypothetical protein